MKSPPAWLEIFIIAAALLLVMLAVMWAESSRRHGQAGVPAALTQAHATR